MSGTGDSPRPVTAFMDTASTGKCTAFVVGKYRICKANSTTVHEQYATRRAIKYLSYKYIATLFAFKSIFILRDF